MARAARDAYQQAARLGLLAALSTACAVVEAPPGGPPDFTPPVVVSLTPDSGAVVEGFTDPLVIRFDEVINERSGGGLDRLVLMSPRVKEVKVSWKRTAIAIKPEDGWQPNLVYHVSLLPGVADLRNNRLTEGRTIIFSTGGPIPDTRLSGTVLDWDNGRAGRGALIEAVLLPDSLVYFAQADSVGEFQLTALPQGTYLALASIDRNNDRERGRREAFDSLTMTLDSSVTTVFWTFLHDSVGAEIRQLTRIDSTTFRVDFDQKLAPGRPAPDAVQVWALPDTTLVALAAIWEKVTYDSVKAVEGEAVAKAAGDTLGTEGAGGAAGADTAVADTSKAAGLLAQRPSLSAVWIVRVAEPLTPGARYIVEARARNVSGVPARSRSLLVLPAPRDST